MTGTQHGLTRNQSLRLAYLLRALKPTEFHHGDCVGADEGAHRILRDVQPGTRTFCHPPKDPKKRAFTVNDVTFPEDEYLVRNQHIVDMTDVLVVLPWERIEQIRSGTWSTYRYAKKRGKVRFVLYP